MESKKLPAYPGALPAPTRTSNVPISDLSILLRGGQVDLDQEFVVHLNGKESWRGIPTRRLEVLLATSRHGDPQVTFEAKIPVQGSR